MNRILIAEDNPRITEFLEAGLQAHGHTTVVAEDGLSALSMADSRNFDLLILDLGLPVKSGFEVLRALRGQGENLPVIVLTARDSVDDTVAVLEGGANDYITKPFRFEELLARIRVQLRDFHRAGSGEITRVCVGDITLDLLTREAWLNGINVELSAREFILMETFMRHPRQVMSREQLLNRIWGYDYEPDSNVLTVYIRRLRGKFGNHLIETVRGMGYRYRP